MYWRTQSNQLSRKMGTRERERAAVAGGKNCSNDESRRLQVRKALTARNNNHRRTLWPTSIQNDDELKRLKGKIFIRVPGAAYCAVSRIHAMLFHAISVPAINSKPATTATTRDRAADK